MPTQRCPLRLCDQIDGSGKVIVRGRHDQTIESPGPEAAISSPPPRSMEARVDARTSKAGLEEVDVSPQARIEAAKAALTQAERSKRYRESKGDEYRERNAARMKALRESLK